MMATLVMGIGVLAVMALFPAAYLRAIQASQLTNSVLLKEQAEVLIDVHDLTSDLYIPQPKNGFINRCIIDPLGIYDGLNDSYGIDGGGTAATYSPTTGSPDYFNLSGGNVNDPLDIPLRRLGFQGNNPYEALGPAPPPFVAYAPDLFPIGSREEVLDAVGLPDRWETVFSAIPSGSTATQVTFDLNEVDAANLTALTGFLELRLVLIDITGKRSEVRVLNPADVNAGAGTIDWVTPLPATVGTIADCRVETPDRRFTWLLTVRKTGEIGQSSTDIDCVVFHNRPAADPEEELVHTAALNAAGGAVYDVTFTAYPSDPTLTPPLRTGGYVFDPAHARWYRIQDITDETATSATITLDRFPSESISVLTIPRGVVGVYALRKRTATGQ